MIIKTGQYNRTVCIVLVVFCLFFFLPSAGFSAVLYRSYVVKYDRGWDILCDPYIVKTLGVGKHTITEDMEIVLRLWKYYRDQKRDAAVTAALAN